MQITEKVVSRRIDSGEVHYGYLSEHLSAFQD